MATIGPDNTRYGHVDTVGVLGPTIVMYPETPINIP